MQLVSFSNFFLIGMGFGFSGIILLGPFLLTMHFLMPRAVLETYFKPPYFRPMEVELFTGIPYAPMRTIMLMWVLAFPRLGKKRGLTQAYLLAPLWYRRLSALFGIWAIVAFTGILSIGLGLYIYSKLMDL